MNTQRKHHSAEFKAKIALEAIRGQWTINQIAAEYSVHPNLITQWKRQALESLPQIFAGPRLKADKDREQLEATLYQQIGST